MKYATWEVREGDAIVGLKTKLGRILRQGLTKYMTFEVRPEYGDEPGMGNYRHQGTAIAKALSQK